MPSWEWRRLSRTGFYVELVISPALLCYLAWAWKICVGGFMTQYLGNVLGRHIYARVYQLTAAFLLTTIILVFLRLYFLPAHYAQPPPNPPAAIANLEAVFEVPPPPRGRARLVASTDVERLIVRCVQGRCRGRWKPPRARHCSECARCRVGFDHHCVFVANCISAPSLPPFLALLLVTPPTVLFLSLPMFRPVAHGMKLAWAASATNHRVQAYWGWGWSWVVPAGPVVRYAVGLFMAWSDLDRADGGAYGELWRVDVGALWIVGNLLALVTIGLGFWQVKQTLRGELGNDVLRMRAFAKAQEALDVARGKGASDAQANAQAAMDKFTSDKWYFVPLDDEEYVGAVIPILKGEAPYDLGWKRNISLMVSRGRWGWFLPWNAARTGMSTAEAAVWPINPNVKARLEGEARRLLDERTGLLDSSERHSDEEG